MKRHEQHESEWHMPINRDMCKAIQSDARAELVQRIDDLKESVRVLESISDERNKLAEKVSSSRAELVQVKTDLADLNKAYGDLRFAFWKYVSDHTGSPQLESEIDEIVHEAGKQNSKMREILDNAPHVRGLSPRLCSTSCPQCRWEAMKKEGKA